MDTANQAGRDRMIRLAEFMAPVQVMEELIGGNCRRYSVLVTGPEGGKTPMVLMEYGCGAEDLRRFEEAAAMLHRLQNLSVKMPRFWVYGSHRVNRFILVEEDPRQLLGLQEISGKPMTERLDILGQLLGRAAELEENGILLQDLDWSCVCCREDRYDFWDYSRARLRRDMTGEQWQTELRTAMAALARMVYHGILGQELAVEDLRPNLTVLLCHVSDWDGFSGFCDTLERCISRETDTRIGRLQEDLDYIRELPPEPGQEEGWEPWQCVADFLHDNPLYPYVRSNAQGERLLKVVLFGSSGLRNAFFDQIFATAQMLDTRLQIHVIAPDAQEFWEQSRRRAPLLERVVRVNGDGSALDPEVAGRDAGGAVAPLAELTFENGDSFRAKELLQDGTGCLILLEPYTDAVSFEICDLVNQTEQPLLVAICQGRPVMHDKVGKHGVTTLRSFRSGGSGEFADTEVYRKALGVQTYYEKYYDQRISAEKILENFHRETNGFYNLRSSVRSALTIPYKFHSCGLGEGENQQFHLQVLRASDRKLCSRMIWLEHRSWQAHLIADGWQLNPADYGGGLDDKKFSQKSEKDKWHCCLRGSHDTGTLPLSDWDWEKEDLTGLDPLDRMSVEIHQALVKKAEHHQQELNSCLNRLAGVLTPAQYQQVRNSVNQLRKRVLNADVGWSRTCRELPLDQKQEDQVISRLLVLVRELVDRNARRDYKQIDYSIIEAIPYLNRKRTFRHVYSLCAGHPWHNVAAALLLEPKTLMLVTDAQHEISDKELGHCMDFLRDRRNLNIEIGKCTFAELTECPDDAVLDVTGADAGQVLAVRNHGALKHLPMVAYRDGGLVSPDGSCGEVSFYPRNHTITVEEMMSLTGTTVLSEYSDIPMHGMYRYRELWEAVQMAALEDRDPYNQTCSFLASLERTWAVMADPCLVDVGVPKKVARIYGFDDLIHQMQAKGLLKKVANTDTARVTGPQQFRDLRDALEEVRKCIGQQSTETGARLVLKTVSDGKFSDWGIFFGDTQIATIRKFRLRQWSTKLSRSQAQANGLLQLLEKLREHGIIEPFSLPGTPGAVTYITACDRYCQDSLNKLLTGYEDAVENGTHRELYLNFAPENANALCELEDRGLEVCRTVAVICGEIRYKCGRENRSAAPAALKSCLEILEGRGLVQRVGADPLISWNEHQAVIHLRYADQAAKSCLTKTGNALEALTYHTLRGMNYFDDVKLGVSIQWDRDQIDGRDTRNEIDVICTKGLRSWFISCKQTHKLEMEYLNEIRFETDRFGLDGVPVLVTTAQYLDSPYDYDRAKRMGIRVISLKKLPLRRDLLNPGAEALVSQFETILE